MIETDTSMGAKNFCSKITRCCSWYLAILIYDLVEFRKNK